MNMIRTELPVCEVTLFEDRAKVRRSGIVELPAGTSQVFIPDVSPVISDRSLLAVSNDDGSLSVGSLSVTRNLKSRQDLESEIAEIEEDIATQKTSLADMTDKLKTIGYTLDARRRILELTDQELPEDIAAGKALDEQKKSRWEELDETLMSLVRDHFDIKMERADLKTKIEDLEIFLEVKKTPSTLCDASIRVDIGADKAGKYPLNIEYIVPGACWRPRHRAVMPGETLCFETDGCVWQNTGEDWKNVSLSFSTHRPTLGTRPPVLSDDKISIIKKAKTDVVEFRDEMIDDAGFGGETPEGGGASDLPGVEDGGIVRVFQANAPADIPSDGRPYRVDIGSFECPTSTDIIVMPELSDYAYVRSIQSNTAEYPILAGPVDLIKENGYVGKTRVLYMAAGEKFVLGWGPDPDLRIHRSVSSKTRESGGLNAWEHSEYTVEIHISNIGGESKTMTIRERIPVSELERVRVKFDTEAATEGFSGPDGDGFIEWPLTLGASERRCMKLVYSIETHRKVIGA